MSNTKLRSADYSINEIVKISSYRSYASRNDMKVMLKKSIRDLHHLGFKIGHVKGFKAKHIYKLVEYWKEGEKSAGTIKNYLSKFRELGKILKDDRLVSSDNQVYNIGSRKYFPTENKAIHSPDFSKCTDPLIRLSMEGQYLFGLRREESIKFIVSKAYTGGLSIHLERTWTKGGIERTIPISSPEQLQWLFRVQDTVEEGRSLIYKDSNYSEQLNKYAYQTRLLGLRKLHGLRHAYAQNRYRVLSAYYDPNKVGWECPYNGGKKFEEMTSEERNVDLKVRNILTREMGHSRLNILKSYLA